MKWTERNEKVFIFGAKYELQRHLFHLTWIKCWLWIYNADFWIIYCIHLYKLYTERKFVFNTAYYVWPSSRYMCFGQLTVKNINPNWLEPRRMAPNVKGHYSINIMGVLETYTKYIYTDNLSKLTEIIKS